MSWIQLDILSAKLRARDWVPPTLGRERVAGRTKSVDRVMGISQKGRVVSEKIHQRKVVCGLPLTVLRSRENQKDSNGVGGYVPSLGSNSGA